MTVFIGVLLVLMAASIIINKTLSSYYLQTKDNIRKREEDLDNTLISLYKKRRKLQVHLNSVKNSLLVAEQQIQDEDIILPTRTGKNR